MNISKIILLQIISTFIIFKQVYNTKEDDDDDKDANVGHKNH